MSSVISWFISKRSAIQGSPRGGHTFQEEKFYLCCTVNIYGKDPGAGQRSFELNVFLIVGVRIFSQRPCTSLHFRSNDENTILLILALFQHVLLSSMCALYYYAHQANKHSFLLKKNEYLHMNNLIIQLINCQK